MNKEKYIEIVYSNNLKFQSINHNIYYTLKDIFWNCSEDYCKKVEYFFTILDVRNIDTSLEIKNINRKILLELLDFLINFDYTKIYFIEEHSTFIKKSNIMLFDDWKNQLLILINLLKKYLY